MMGRERGGHGAHAAGVLPLQPPLHEALLDLKLLQQCLRASLPGMIEMDFAE